MPTPTQKNFEELETLNFKFDQFQDVIDSSLESLKSELSGIRDESNDVVLEAARIDERVKATDLRIARLELEKKVDRGKRQVDHCQSCFAGRPNLLMQGTK